MAKLWDKGQPLDALVEQYTVGDDPRLDAALVPFDIAGSLGHAQGLHRAGLLDDEEHAALAAGLLRVAALYRDGGFTITRSQEDVHTAVEELLTSWLGDTGRKLHTGRSRNDQVLTDTRLWAKQACYRLARATDATVSALLGLAERALTVPLPGFTHLRRAMPSTVGLWALGHASELLRGLHALAAAHQGLDRCPLGSAAGYGVGLDLPRAEVARALGFAAPEHAVTAAQPGRGRDAIELLFACWGLCRTLGALSWDGILFSDEERRWFRLPARFTTGSSIMPQKKNPDVLELTRGRAGTVYGCLAEAMHIAGPLPSGYHRDYQLLKGPLMRGVEETHAALRICAHVLVDLEVDAERCAAAVVGPINATDRALELVDEGLPFRTAYRQAAAEVHAGQLDERPAGAPRGTLAPAATHAQLSEEAAAWRRRWDAWSTPQREALRALMGDLCP